MINLLWDLTIEAPTLGGALVLRSEGEILAEINGVNNLRLSIKALDIHIPIINKITDVVFSTSEIFFETNIISGNDVDVYTWPLPNHFESPYFSYCSFARLEELYRKYHILPRLKWSRSTLAKSENFLKLIGETLITVHLKNVHPYSIEESVADGFMWQAFFNQAIGAESCIFVLLGDDIVPNGVSCTSRIIRAKDFGIDLASQLALISISRGFLGMASGICTSANLSAAPYCIFKHPMHHAKQMKIELGNRESFAFAKGVQKILRTELTSDLIFDEFIGVLHD